MNALVIPAPTFTADELVRELWLRLIGRPRHPFGVLLEAYLELDRVDRRRVIRAVHPPELAWLERLRLAAPTASPHRCAQAALALRAARRLWEREGSYRAQELLEPHLALLQHVPTARDLWCFLKERRGQPRGRVVATRG